VVLVLPHYYYYYYYYYNLYIILISNIDTMKNLNETPKQNLNAEMVDFIKNGWDSEEYMPPDYIQMVIAYQLGRIADILLVIEQKCSS